MPPNVAPTPTPPAVDEVPLTRSRAEAAPVETEAIDPVAGLTKVAVAPWPEAVPSLSAAVLPPAEVVNEEPSSAAGCGEGVSESEWRDKWPVPNTQPKSPWLSHNPDQAPLSRPPDCPIRYVPLAAVDEPSEDVV